MITVYKKTELGLDQIDEVAPGTWIHLIDPTRTEVEQLLAVIDIPAVSYTHLTHRKDRRKVCMRPSSRHRDDSPSSRLSARLAGTVINSGPLAAL